MIARPDLDSRSARPLAEPPPGFGRPWRLIAGGSPRAAPDTDVVEAALHLLAEHFEQGLAVTDRSGRAHFLNRAAQGFVGRGLLRLEHGCLRGTTPEDGAALRRILAGSAEGRAGSARLAGEGGTLLVAACAIPATVQSVAATAGSVPATAGSGAVLLRLIDPAVAPLPSPGALQSQFGFTPAEAALAVDILAGNDLAASARRRGITRNTVRVHLRRLFEKTGTRRQAELMRLLLLCPQPIVAEAAVGPAPEGTPRPGMRLEISALGPVSSPNGGCAQTTIQRR